MGANNPKIRPFSRGTWTPPNTSMPGPQPVHSLSQTTVGLVHAFLQYATTSLLVTMGRPKLTPKTAPSPLTITTPSNRMHSSLDWLPTQYSPSQTASVSIQLFCHSTLSGQTDIL